MAIGLSEMSNSRHLASAQAELRSELESAIGPDLPGIFGFGAGLDYVTRQPALNVLVDSAATASRVSARLPKKIGGLPVRVSQRGPAIMD